MIVILWLIGLRWGEPGTIDINVVVVEPDQLMDFQRGPLYAIIQIT